VVRPVVFMLREPCQFRQRVTIRVINLNETPFKNKQVYISGLSEQAASWKEEHFKLTGKPIRADLSLLTDSKARPRLTHRAPRPLTSMFGLCLASGSGIAPASYVSLQTNSCTKASFSSRPLHSKKEAINSAKARGNLVCDGAVTVKVATSLSY